MVSNGCKTIALMGKAKTGKSFIISRFVENKKSYVNLFCGNNKSKTICPIKVDISEKEQQEGYEVESRLSIYQYMPQERSPEDNELFDKQLNELRQDIAALENKTYEMDDADTMGKIESISTAQSAHDDDPSGTSNRAKLGFPFSGEAKIVAIVATIS